jgi:hypothetical protein
VTVSYPYLRTRIMHNEFGGHSCCLVGRQPFFRGARHAAEAYFALREQ